MEIKKLTKEEKAEGLTLDLVNKVDLRKKCSPVMFKGGDEPVGIMECSTGYWVHTSDGYLRDDKGNYNLLLDIMGIEKIPNPISFKLDSISHLSIAFIYSNSYVICDPFLAKIGL